MKEVHTVQNIPSNVRRRDPLSHSLTTTGLHPSSQSVRVSTLLLRQETVEPRKQPALQSGVKQKGQSKYAGIQPEHISPSLLSVATDACRTLFLPMTLLIGVTTFGALIAIPRNVSTKAATEVLALLPMSEPAPFEAHADAEAPAIKPIKPVAAAASLQNDVIPELVAEQKGLMKFIAGMIAMTRPNIKDVGKVAREIVAVSAKRKIDPFYIAAIISVESRFHEQARSSVGATGLMQLMPATARGIACERGMGGRSLTDTEYNIILGSDYIKSLEKRYRGNKYLALAAYNWGPANVDRVTRGNGHIPGSVRRYASTVLERSVNWSRHYKKAKESANFLEQQAVLAAAEKTS